MKQDNAQVPAADGAPVERGVRPLPQSDAGWLHRIDDETAKAWQAGYAQGRKRAVALTRTELHQLLDYAQHCENEGWYWGNAAQFRKRHDKLKAWLNAQIDVAA